MLVGRTAERAVIDHLLTAARDGRSGVLVVRGEAGIGKSSLLQHAVAQAKEFTVLVGVGIESESELPYAALHQVVRPVLDRIDRLPDPQAASLRAAFALSNEEVGDRFRVSLGALSLLAEVAEDGPLLCIVDDAQWLDQASADTLVFVARRLEAEALLLLFAARDVDTRPFAAPGLPEIRMTPLAPAESRELLAARIGVNAAPEAVDWLLDSAGGNPLALQELPHTLTDDQLAGRETLARALPPATSVEQAYLERTRHLSPEAQRWLVVAAAEETGERATIARAAAELELDEASLAAVESEGLVLVTPDRIEFRHPLVRSAVYRGAGFAERELAHRALATALAGEGDADRRAWHRAAATVGADDDVAAELEATAGRAQLRAGHGAAAAALERAAELSNDPTERGARLVRAAAAAGLAGRTARAIVIADRAEPLVTDPALRAELAQVRGDAELFGGRPETASDFFHAGARAVVGHDGRRAFELVGASIRAAAMCADSGRVQRGLELGKSLAPDPEDPEQVLMDKINRGVDAIQHGDAPAGVPLLHEALASADPEKPREVYLAAVAATFLGDHGAAQELHGRVAADARRAGALGPLVVALSSQAGANFLARRLSEAGAQADEAARLARDLGVENPVAQPLALLAWIAALEGREHDCRRLADQALELAGARGLALPAALATWAVAELDLGRGRWEDALRGLEALGEVRPGFGHPLLALISTPDRVEAAVRGGRPDAATDSFAQFEAWAHSSKVPWAAAAAERCLGLLAPGDEAAAHFEEALRRHGEDGSAFDRARTELVYGELLRREKKRVEARGHLRRAQATFEQFNAAPWLERASSELRATGETARKRDPSTLAHLTPQERQIAGLVAEGGSNKEIAAQLFLSPRTVEYHLRKVFQKLGIASRAELIRQGVAPDSHPEQAVVSG